MASRNKLDEYDDEEMNINPKSSLLEDSKQDDSGGIPMCGFLSVKFYQGYFDLDTDDIINRIKLSVVYCGQPETFLDHVIAKNVDAYGPFWIATTLIFVVAVTSHISSWLFSWMRGVLWTYDFQNVVTLASIVYGYVTISPMAIWVLYRQLEVPVKAVPIACLYGYSLFIYIPLTILCIIPSKVIHWLALLGAAASSYTFLLRNLAPILVTSGKGKHAAIVMGCLGVLQLAFFLSLKILYF